jgi:hypothetical protein
MLKIYYNIKSQLIENQESNRSKVIEFKQKKRDFIIEVICSKLKDNEFVF